MSSVEAFILALVEGLTEFLPISSTAHMIFTSELLGIKQDDFFKMFTVSIQFGAILAVVVTYWKRFFDFKNARFYAVLFVAVIPALVLGKLFDDKIEAILEKPIPIAMVLILGGVFLLFIDKIFKNNTSDQINNISYKKALAIGLWQCLAMMPGTSRAAASIIGGMQQGLNRKTAAEFSFFLAVPTMLAVTAYSVFIKTWHFHGNEIKGFQLIMENQQNLMAFVIGNVVSFLVAFFAIKYFISLLQKFGFRMWGWYRIIAGAVLMIYFFLL
ncbi:MAG: undecaprenyl-diphosphate phosphatase [Flavobacteriia bacterium]|nr:undecaprenyl-diphosphate phosphatase [Flavobacteriia bacterium]